MLNILQGLTRYVEIDEIMNRLAAYEDACEAADIELDQIANLKIRADCMEAKALALGADIADLRNELCLKCGGYHMAHEGRCDGCRWRRDSI